MKNVKMGQAILYNSQISKLKSFSFVQLLCLEHFYAIAPLTRVAESGISDTNTFYETLNQSSNLLEQKLRVEKLNYNYVWIKQKTSSLERLI